MSAWWARLIASEMQNNFRDKSGLTLEISYYTAGRKEIECIHKNNYNQDIVEGIIDLKGMLF